MKLAVFTEQFTHYKKEDLSSQITGLNSNFFINETPTNNTLNLFWNGHLLKIGINNDFILSGKIIITNFIPYAGNTLIVEYFYKEI